MDMNNMFVVVFDNGKGSYFLTDYDIGSDNMPSKVLLFSSEEEALAFVSKVNELTSAKIGPSGTVPMEFFKARPLSELCMTPSENDIFPSMKDAPAYNENDPMQALLTSLLSKSKLS